MHKSKVVDVASDEQDLSLMVSYAKQGNFDEVFSYLDKKPYLLNDIPEGRAWSILHQAMYWKDPSVIIKLMSYSCFDGMVPTRECKDGFVRARSSALDIAKENGGEQIYNLIKEHVLVQRRQRLTKEIPYVISRRNGIKIRDESLGGVLMEILIMKESRVDSGNDILNIMSKVLQKFSMGEISPDMTKNKISHSVYFFCKRSAKDLNMTTSDRQYFEQIIRLYTTTFFHSEVDRLISISFKPDYLHDFSNQDLRLYVLMLDVVVSHWKSLPVLEVNTYRGTEIDITTKFSVGDDIMFSGILSCSKSYVVADGFRCQGGKMATMIIIDNSALTDMRPRYIGDYSMNAKERECVYPIGAEFRVTYINRLSKTVCLQLLT